MTIQTLIEEELFYHYYQPIYNLEDESKMGYEVLLRTDTYENPENLFQEARNTNLLYELDTKSISKGVKSYELNEYTKQKLNLFLNVFPSTLLNPTFQTFLHNTISTHNLSNHQIVLEISEAEVIEDYTIMSEYIKSLKKLGFKLAVDDVGKGNSSIRAIIDLKPHFIKLDRYFTIDLDQDKAKQAVIHFLLNYCKEFGSHLILEGVESKTELTIAKGLGIQFVQGYVLGKPIPPELL